MAKIPAMSRVVNGRFDYTHLQPGERDSAGRVLAACPKCGRTGLPYANTRLFVVVHAGEFATDEKGGKIQDACLVIPGASS